MTAETTMLAASIGKTFVAAAVLQMSDEGKLNLDDPISNWLGDKAWFDRLPNANTITIRHLLQHSSGLLDHVHMQAFSDLWLGGAEDPAPEDLIELVLDTEPLFAAGEGWSYSDTGYLLIGLIIERVAGQSYEDVVQSRFLTPLKLTSTGPSNQKRLPQLARGYASDEPGLGLPAVTTDDGGAMIWNPAIEWTGGGLYATSHDLALWGQAFLSGRLLTKGPHEEALRGVFASHQDVNSLYGLGVSIRLDSPWGPVYGHRGWIPGYVSSLQYYPDFDTTIAFQTNTDIGIIDVEAPTVLQIEEQIAAVALGRAVTDENGQRSPDD
jgi:D-alanyl-D-alanine carboxypeptidase